MSLSAHQERGLIGEEWACEELRRRGYAVEMIPDFYNNGCDLRIAGRLPVEVKTAYPTWRRSHGKMRKRWQFHIGPESWAMSGPWLLILIAVDSTGHKHYYLLPGQAIKDRPHIQITSHPDLYGGWLKYWRNRWSVVDTALKELFAWEKPRYQVLKNSDICEFIERERVAA